MKILILGGDGMLGHQLLRHFQPIHQTMVTLRRRLEDYNSFKLFTKDNAFDLIDVSDPSQFNNILSSYNPDVVINAIGIVKQRTETNDAILNIEINALLPHRLAQECRSIGARLVHISTDCVFSGSMGNYTELDLSDAIDIYGKTKALGEVSYSNCITLRTSIIGPELSRKSGLFEWFRSQVGRNVEGFEGAIFSGFTTREMSRIIELVITKNTNYHGVFNVSSNAINKYDLLTMINKKFGGEVNIIKNKSFHCDRSLNSQKFREAYNYTPPSWAEMISEL